MPCYFCRSPVKALALPRLAVAAASRIPAGRPRRARGWDPQDAAQPRGQSPRALGPVRGGRRGCHPPVALGGQAQRQSTCSQRTGLSHERALHLRLPFSSLVVEKTKRFYAEEGKSF